VNDDGDPDSLPDTLYLSDGATNSVSVVRQASVSGTLSTNSLSVQITASMPDDWTYLLIPDPGQGKFKLKRVVRSDNREIASGTNVWTTDRTFIGKGRKPITENVLHLFDYKSPGTYTLFYDLIPPPESTPPISKVDPLPTNSYTQIPITWSGADNPGGSGVGFFDIFVSVEGGPYAAWLEHTDQTGATYFGQLGKKYAFYSVATDNVGNREAAHPTADAQTTITLENHPPLISPILDQRLLEGDVFTLAPLGSDPDSNILTWSLVGATPPGLQINPGSGLITWITGAGLGPSTNRIVVQALDDGIPRLGALRAFNIILDERNFPPEFQAVGTQIIREGQLLLLTNVVNDPDWPPQRITFQSAGALPDGLALNPQSGVLAWQPNDVQGGSNYVINVVATDSGVPSLSATQSVRITVLDTRSDFTVRLGSTNVTAGTGSYLPIYLQSVADITNLVLDLIYSNTRVTNLTLQAAPGIANATLENVASNRFLAHISAAPGTVLPASGEIARLLFLADTNGSAVLPFTVPSAQAIRSNGTPLQNGSLIGAPIFLVREQPVLGVSMNNGQPNITLYGPPGQTFEIQYETNLTSTVSWASLSTIVSTSQFTLLTNLPNVSNNLFLRARALDPNTPRLFLSSRPGGGWDLYLSGKAGASYRLESRVFQGDTTWHNDYTLTLTNGSAKLPIFQKNDAGRFYRGALNTP
jgi:hypothetical protein